ncbi:hypothetical protein HDR61_04840 [bacterium]|nr:hypothetical protein [bacterium]
MQVNHNNRAIVAKSSKLAVFIELWKSFVEYANDYFAGQKHKHSEHLKQEKQNTK